MASVGSANLRRGRWGSHPSDRHARTGAEQHRRSAAPRSSVPCDASAPVNAVDHPLDHLRLEIDQDVATDDQIELATRRQR